MTANSTNALEWYPEKIINGSNLKTAYACLVLNRKIKAPPDVVERLWQNAECRCTVDGGTNRWKEFLITNRKENELKPPDYITGDFDSITKETSAYFNRPDIKRVHTPDQNHTDFTKAIHVLHPFLQEKEIKDIFVFHDTSGRLDHIMANLQTLFNAPQTMNVYLIAGNSLTWLLRPTVHSIHIPKDLVDNSRWCSLLPVGNSAVVTSIGLKWDLNESVLQFGDGIISTSNTYLSREIHIQTNSPIVWSMGVFNFADDS